MEWIVNPDIIDRMNESDFSLIQFTTNYFEKTWGNVNSPQHRGKYYRIGSDDVNHSCDFIGGVRFFGNSYCGETPYIEYGRTMVPSHSKLMCSNKYVTMITFTADPFAELLSFNTINAYMLFVKESAIDMRETTNVENEECCNVPDTGIWGLIQTKTAYSFDVSKLTVGHPYRIRFLGDIEIFDKKYKSHDEIYAVLASADEDSLKFATTYSNIGHDDKNSIRVSGAFELKPDMKFELDKLA